MTTRCGGILPSHQLQLVKHISYVKSSRACRRRSGAEEIKEVADPDVRLQRVPEPALGRQRVGVPPADPGHHEEPRLDEIADDQLDGTLGDADPGCDVPHPRLGVQGQVDQHVPVVRQQGPGRVLHPSSMANRVAPASPANFSNAIRCPFSGQDIDPRAGWWQILGQETSERPKGLRRAHSWPTSSPPSAIPLADSLVQMLRSDPAHGCSRCD
jgi:hypothetical protein